MLFLSKAILNTDSLTGENSLSGEVRGTLVSEPDNPDETPVAVGRRVSASRISAHNLVSRNKDSTPATPPLSQKVVKS